MPGKEIKGRSKRAMYKDGSLKPIPEGNKGLPKLPKEVRNNMGFLKVIASLARCPNLPPFFAAAFILPAGIF